jgi:hypothetical protein
MAEVTLENVTKVYGDGVVAVKEMAPDIPDDEFMVFASRCRPAGHKGLLPPLWLRLGDRIQHFISCKRSRGFWLRNLTYIVSRVTL